MQTTTLDKKESKALKKLESKTWSNFITLFCGLMITYSLGPRKPTRLLEITTLVGAMMLFFEFVAYCRAMQLFSDRTWPKDLLIWGRFAVISISTISSSLLWIYILVAAPHPDLESSPPLNSFLHALIVVFPFLCLIFYIFYVCLHPARKDLLKILSWLVSVLTRKKK